MLRTKQESMIQEAHVTLAVISAISSLLVNQSCYWEMLRKESPWPWEDDPCSQQRSFGRSNMNPYSEAPTSQRLGFSAKPTCPGSLVISQSLWSSDTTPSSPICCSIEIAILKGSVYRSGQQATLAALSLSGGAQARRTLSWWSL